MVQTVSYKPAGWPLLKVTVNVFTDMGFDHMCTRRNVEQISYSMQIVYVPPGNMPGYYEMLFYSCLLHYTRFLLLPLSLSLSVYLSLSLTLILTRPIMYTVHSGAYNIL